ncbi:DNA mismatch repair protein MutL [Vararia minispora EC-137]|uniref:DNA mismatch repair protein MutL n=1 Tax=Vararia minispora EC-137 TaxID=1314806 RepID=A0ACB8QF92_9AGAM|nr:DNA mismatch repair protein MutL [Vararia minispora EC-137]
MAVQPRNATNSIKAIDPTSIHQITSGQVVVDLQGAVKELVENSLDAGATNIEVRLKDGGVEVIEVVDNGSGIAPEDYSSVALKHTTSKLEKFEDLSTVDTFGFRGEALSSLCALSEKVTMTTSTGARSSMGVALEFGMDGQLMNSDKKVARQRGTTVSVHNIFKPYPVRRKELEKNVKRELNKMLHLMEAYALVPCTRENRGVRFAVSNQAHGGKKVEQINLPRTTSLRSAVSALWGRKSLDNLIDLDLEFEVETERAVLRRRGKDSSKSKNTVRVRGLISKFSVGCGRSGTDRQFYFVNGRPCSPGKVAKAFNDVYKTFNMTQSPFIVADFLIPTDSCDINVSPDKRTILLHSEGSLVEALKV